MITRKNQSAVVLTVVAEGRGRTSGGSGRWKKDDQQRKDRLEADLKLLRDNILPEEQRARAVATEAELRATARQHTEHHAGGSAVPRGPIQTTNNAGDVVGNGDDDDDDDDGEANPNFGNFYRVSEAQRAFNQRQTKHFLGNAANLDRAFFDPPDVAKSGCNPAFIGVGRLHVHAPHRFLGYELPPCPKHGWPSVDQKKVKTKGCCEARRVYAHEQDEWVSGQRMLCTLCLEEKRSLEAERDDLKAKCGSSDEITAAEVAVKNCRYLYQSYNPESVRLYAERYPG